MQAKPPREALPSPTSDPAPGSPWDDPIDEAPLVFLDLEMTGLRPAVDRVIEICAERVRGDRIEDSITSLVQPEGGAFGNAHIHGISPDELTTAPPFSAIAEHVERVLDGGVIIAHSAPWDVAFLLAELRRAGRAPRIEHYLDTLTL